MPRIQRKPGGSVARWAGLLSLCGLLLACQSPSEEEDEAAFVAGFAGLVAADEPRAAVIGRDVLTGGGNAADAAVAMYFAMTVTLPSRASLGSGGVCVVFDNGDKTGEVLEFVPRPSGAGAVPVGARAMAALHARQGLTNWGELVSPAENLARFGHGLSRAFARDLAAFGTRIAADPELARTFQANGAVPGEGDRLTQLELAAVLSGIRAQGAGYVHNSQFTNRFAEAMAQAGQSVDLNDLRQATPRYGTAITLPWGDDLLYFSGPPANGILAAQLWQIFTAVEDYEDLDAGERAHLVAEAAARAFGDRARWLRGPAVTVTDEILGEAHVEALMSGYDGTRHIPVDGLATKPVRITESPFGAGFAVADRFGNAVVCSLTMNGLFGSGRMAPGTGIVLAAPASGQQQGLLSPSAAILGNPVNGDVFLAATASGGAAAATALVQVMLGALVDEKDLETVIRAVRFHHGGRPDELFYESGIRRELVPVLHALGHTLQEATSLGQVNALYCPDGIRDEPQACQVTSDPRGAGLSFVVQ